LPIDGEDRPDTGVSDPDLGDSTGRSQVLSPSAGEELRELHAAVREVGKPQRERPSAKRICSFFEQPALLHALVLYRQALELLGGLMRTGDHMVHDVSAVRRAVGGPQPYDVTGMQRTCSASVSLAYAPPNAGAVLEASASCNLTNEGLAPVIKK
jgi:hypothetical protein